MRFCRFVDPLFVNPWKALIASIKSSRAPTVLDIDVGLDEVELLIVDEEKFDWVVGGRGGGGGGGGDEIEEDGSGGAGGIAVFESFPEKSSFFIAKLSKYVVLLCLLL